MDKQQEFVLRTLEERDIRFVRLWFTDVLGLLKSVAVAPAELEGAFAEGIGFDGSAIEGFARVYEADMLAKPDPATFQVLPWRGEAPGHGADVLRHPDAGRHAVASPTRATCCKRALAQGRRRRASPSTPTPRSSSSCSRTSRADGGAPEPGRPRRLLRPHPARHRPRLPPRRDHHARVDGHLGRVQPPRGRARPAGDRPALRRRAHHGRQHHDVPAR